MKCLSRRIFPGYDVGYMPLKVVSKVLSLGILGKLLKLPLNVSSSLILFLPACLRRAILQHRSFNCQSQASNPTILGYLPVKASGWILEYLFRDIAACANDTCFVLVKSPAELLYHFLGSNQSIVFTLHPSFVSQIIDIGISPKSIVSFYTHSRLGINLSFLKDIRAVLPMNSTEAAALALSGINSKIIRVFPAGYNPALFFVEPCSEEMHRQRIIDVLFVCRYEESSNQHYILRKAYPMVIALGKALASRGYNVSVLGRGWKNCSDDHFKNIVQTTELVHDDYPSLYRSSKLLVTPSLQEGGPVSWLEAMACGCLTLSTSSGFPTELRSGQLGSYIMPIRSSIQEWMDEIIRILDLPEALASVNMLERQTFLSSATFAELAKVLEEIACKPTIDNSSLSWPSLTK